MKKHLFPVLIFVSVFVLFFTCPTRTFAEDFTSLKERAEQGDAWTQFKLGAMYTSGQGVPQDYARAYMWSNLAAADLGNENAMKFSHLPSTKLR